MVEAAHATSAAPTYFEPVQLGAATLIDGGVFAINPSLVAYAEVRGKLDLMLSLGTGSHTRPLPYDKIKDWGQLEWARPVIDVVFDGGQDAVDIQLGALLPEGYVRLQTSSRRPATTSTTRAPATSSCSAGGRGPHRRQRRADRRRLRAPHGVASAAARVATTASGSLVSRRHVIRRTR